MRILVKALILVPMFLKALAGSAAETRSSFAAEYKLHLAAADYPESFDPLDSDLTNNIDMMKMRYAAPLEIEHNDKFTSLVLESFDYDISKKLLTWKVKSGLKYSDGSALVTDDIVLSIKRMALKRKGFPVLSSIKGLDAWVKQKFPLMSELEGVKVHGNTISIYFDDPIANPFFQFSLQLFAIQPSRCFDFKSSKSICSLPPASGYYTFAREQDLQKPKEDVYPPIQFVIRKGFETSHGFKMPQKVTFEYSKLRFEDLVKKIDDRSVVRTLDSRLSDDFINSFRNTVEIKRLPKTAIWYLLLNPNFEAFKEKSCRRIFANAYRDLYGERVTSTKIAARSFSSLIMPGYLSNEALDKTFPEENKRVCYNLFKKHPVKYKKISPSNPNFVWDKLAIDTMNKVGMPTTYVYGTEEAFVNFFAPFENNEAALVTAAVNFWPLDLASGFKMFFTPDMHSNLKYLLKDGKLSELADRLFKEQDGKKAAEYYQKINEHLYDEAQLNALSYYGNVYVSKASGMSKLPIATSEPNPWHLFSVK